MGSGVVAKTQDLLWKEKEGYVHTQRREGTERWRALPSAIGGAARFYLRSWVGAS